MGQPVQRADTAWLTLRRAADEVSRENAADLLARLNDHLAAMLTAVAPAEGMRAGSTDGVVSIFDIGAGSGANLDWLAPRLACRQRWTLVDRDHELLSSAPGTAVHPNVVSVRRLAADVDDLAMLLPSPLRPSSGSFRPSSGSFRPSSGSFRPSSGSLRSSSGSPRSSSEVERPLSTALTLVTCSAVLDILSIDQIASLCSLLAARQLAAFFSLSVTGAVEIIPGHPADTQIGAAFNAHQRRRGLAGPDAVDLAANGLVQSGLEVTLRSTPWMLGSTDRALIERYLRDRGAVAVEQEPALTAEVAGWLTDRLARLQDGALTVRVEHQDLLALPS